MRIAAAKSDGCGAHSKPVSPSLFAHFVLRTANREPLKQWYLTVLNARQVFASYAQKYTADGDVRVGQRAVERQ